MALREEFTKQGDWLFRWRSYLPLLLLPLAGLALLESAQTPLMFGYPYDYIFIISCIAISLSGMFIRAMTIGYIASGTSGGNTKEQRANTLNTSGIYSIVRHPLYLGNFIIVLGIVLFIKIWWFIVITGLAFWLYYERIMYREEEFLRDKFGEAYDTWAEETPAFIPRVQNRQKPDMQFSLWKIIKREYIGLFEIIVCFTLLDHLQDYIKNGIFRFQLGWAIFFSVGLLFFIIVRIIKKGMKTVHRKRLQSNKI